MNTAFIWLCLYWLRCVQNCEPGFFTCDLVTCPPVQKNCECVTRPEVAGLCAWWDVKVPGVTSSSNTKWLVSWTVTQTLTRASGNCVAPDQWLTDWALSPLTVAKTVSLSQLVIFSFFAGVPLPSSAHADHHSLRAVGHRLSQTVTLWHLQ